MSVGRERHRIFGLLLKGPVKRCSIRREQDAPRRRAGNTDKLGLQGRSRRRLELKSQAEPERVMKESRLLGEMNLLVSLTKEAFEAQSLSPTFRGLFSMESRI